MSPTLGFDLHHENHVIEQHDSVGEFLALFPSARISVDEVPEKRAFEEPLAPFFFVSAALAPGDRYLAHPEPQPRKFVEIKHLGGKAVGSLRLLFNYCANCARTRRRELLLSTN